MKSEKIKTPKFKNESQEADWWASPTGRNFVKQKSAETRAKGTKVRGSALLTKLNKSVQIAIRLPEADLARARAIASRKGIGYQTFLKMLVHEGLSREGQ
jgi:predicted DNA binding CopG/RHH family protein